MAGMLTCGPVHRVPDILRVREPPPPCRARGAARPCCACYCAAARGDVASTPRPSELMLELGQLGHLVGGGGMTERAGARAHWRWAHGWMGWWTGTATWVLGRWPRVLPGLCDERGGGGGVVGAWGGRGVLLGVADGGGEGGRAAGDVLKGEEVVVEL